MLKSLYVLRWRILPGNHFSWNRSASCRDNPSRINDGIDSKMRPISYDGSQLSPVCIDELIFYHNFDIATVMPEVCDLGTASDVDVISDNRISDIAQVRNMGIISNIRILHLDRKSDL